MTDPKTAAILQNIAGNVLPMCITTSGELNEAGKHVVTFHTPGHGLAIMEMSADYAFGLALALVNPFLAE